MHEIRLNEIYDPFDMTHMTIPGEFEYKQTIEIDKGIYVDFDVNDAPVSIEMIMASKHFGLLSRNFENAKKEGKIMITHESIRFEMHVHFMKRLISIDREISNDFGIESGQYSFSNY